MQVELWKDKELDAGRGSSLNFTHGGLRVHSYVIDGVVVRRALPARDPDLIWWHRPRKPHKP